MSKPQVGLSQPAALIPGVTTCNFSIILFRMSPQKYNILNYFLGMASTTTTNAVSGGITNNTPDVSANPAESKDFLELIILIHRRQISVKT